ncbi:uncharacterized protein GIQ15_06480 [Arthroderma uncinatum]|uniref:uncharacterized protein n=1 Tax=Arthroderma uncinatum TaxID=74035 RepID=UPI00144AB5F6|nr:uncharacterized protein GIQ15_06480 [Arthroderma uncinatum]KAF3479504.1 hypothetical protein GIQ15_06480 [Arthroderma uncinatum]
MVLERLSVLASISAVFTALVGYFVIRCIYDLFFHPLRKFPGPKLAAIGSFYEFYYDVVKDGKYLWEIKRMHQKYGPIIRINSKSLHIHDPEYYSTVYAGGGRKVNKEISSVAGYTFPQSSLSTIDHDLHRRRRAVIGAYFSQRAIMDMEPFINERLDTLCSSLEKTIGRGVHADLTWATAAFTADVILYHFYGSHPNFLDNKDFKYDLKDALTGLFDFYHLTRFLPFPPTTIKNLPLWILRLLDRRLLLAVEGRNNNKKMILSYLNSTNHTKEETKMRSRSVIVSALTDSSVPAKERTLDRLLDEGETIIFAGMDTSSRVICFAMFHLLNNKRLLLRLRQELDSRKKSADQWTTAELKALPYMEGVVQEGLRLSYGLVVRVPRISTQEPLQYKGYTIPPGTPVSLSSYLMHNDPSVFPNPHIFDPERWIKASQEGINLDKYMLFEKLWLMDQLPPSLAYAQIYLGIAAIASRLDMELFDTTQQDIEVYHARGPAYPKEGPGSVKVKVTGVCEAKHLI